MAKRADVSESYWYETVTTDETVAAGGRVESMINGLAIPPSPETIVLFRRAVLILALLGGMMV